MLNQVNLIGNVGKNPEIKEVNGKKLAKFSLATSETYKDKSGQKQTKTEWHNITIWGKMAEIVEKWVKKGDKLFLSGKVTYRNYEKDEKKTYFTEIVAKEIIMLGGLKKEQ